MGASIVIAGGGVIGSSTAYYLARAGAPVTVVEPDPTYEFAATPRAVGGIRFQHGLESNVRMSLFGSEVYRDFVKYGFQQNLLVQGRFPLGGKRVNLGNIVCPLLNLTAKDIIFFLSTRAPCASP